MADRTGTHSGGDHDTPAAAGRPTDLDRDDVFGDDGGASQLATVTGDVGSGYTVALAVGVDTATTPTGGQLSGDDARSGAPPGGSGGGGRGGPPPSGPAS